MREVPRVKTPVSTGAASQFLLAALVANGEQPHRQEAQLLLAQLWLETARGTACDNFNPGNITAGSKWTGDIFRPAWFTVTDKSSAKLKQLHALMLKGQAPNAFRSYDTFERGFADYVTQLLHTFPSIVRAARSADASAVARAIKSSGYAPDMQPGTDKSLDSLRAEFERGGVFRALPLAPAPSGSSPPAAPPPCS